MHLSFVKTNYSVKLNDSITCHIFIMNYFNLILFFNIKFIINVKCTNHLDRINFENKAKEFNEKLIVTPKYDFSVHKSPILVARKFPIIVVIGKRKTRFCYCRRRWCPPRYPIRFTGKIFNVKMSF